MSCKEKESLARWLVGLGLFFALPMSIGVFYGEVLFVLGLYATVAVLASSIFCLVNLVLWLSGVVSLCK